MNQQQIMFSDMNAAIRANKGSTTQFPSQDITRLKHGGNEFSSQANKSIKSDKARIRNMVLAYIGAQWNHGGSTAEQTADALGLTLQTTSARFAELKALDKIKLVGRRKTKSGRSAGVWAVK